MQLDLKNPIVFFDLETTGINIVKDRIVEIAMLKINPDGSEEEKVMLINPEMPIPSETTAIHGITDDDVKDAPTFKEVAKLLVKFIEGADLAGYNSSRFDIPLLAEEFLRVGVDVDFSNKKSVDVQAIFHKMEQRTLSAAYKFYCDKDLEGAHSAMVDTRATYEVLKAQLDKYENETFKDKSGKKSTPIKNDMQALNDFSSYNNNVDFVGRIVYDKNGMEVFNFGKNKGVPVEKVLEEQPGYYAWMMNSEFPLYTKNVLTRIKLRMMTK